MSENSTEIGTVTDGGSFGGRWTTALDEEWMLQLFVKSVLLVEEDASDKLLKRLGYFASVKQQLPLERFRYSSYLAFH